jgi:two-component system chemotaxis response regulator CheY
MAVSVEAAQTTKTILVVDDSPVIRSVVNIYLQKQPWKILEADGAERALSIIRLVPVDLVIADQNMPGMSGLAFVAALRADADEVKRKIPVVLITADTRATDLKTRGAQVGVNAFLKKPVSSAGLIQTVQSLLSPA